MKSASTLRDNIKLPWPTWPPAWRVVARGGPRGEPGSRVHSTHFSTALGDSAGAQLGSAAAICNLHYLCSEEGGHKDLSLLSHSLLVKSFKKKTAEYTGKRPRLAPAGVLTRRRLLSGWRSPGAGQGPSGPQARCSPSLDSTHFSQPRKHNEPGRSSHQHRRFKVATCLQLPFSPAGWEKRRPKTWKRGDVLSRE